MISLLRRLFTPALLAIFASLHIPSAADQPNIVVVLVDDLGFADFSEEKMPRLTELARQGHTLELYAQQSCMPTRATFLTGNHPAKYQMFQNFDDARFYSEPLSGITDPTIADTLRDAGYATYEIGKWHVGKYNHEQQFARGFDEYFTRVEINGAEYNSMRYDVWLFDSAARSVMAKAPRPFFLYLAHHAPHTPYFPLTYDEMVNELDNQIADLHADLPPNTVFVFMSDNGATEEGGSNEPFRGWKGDYYNGALRVANFVTGIEPTKAPVWVGDFHETFAELAGAELPVTDGGSILQQEMRRGTENDQKYLVPCVRKRRPEGQNVKAKFAAVEDWRKYIRIVRFTNDGDVKSTKEEFYDLRVDVGEDNDVADDPDYEVDLDLMRANFEHWGGDHRLAELKTIDLEEDPDAEWEEPEEWSQYESHFESAVWP